VAGAVPESLRQLIEQQLEQVNPEDQTILEAASVVGMEFPAAAVVAGVEGGPEAVEARCEALARRGQFLEARGSASWPDGTVAARYGFIHALYQEVLYHRVPAGQGVRLHRDIGARLEAGFGGQAREIAAELAVHFVRGRDAPRAVQYLRHAGENALQRSAYQEAVAHLTKGLEVLGTLPDTVERARQEVDLQTTLGVAFMGAKGYGAAEVGTACARARALCQQMGEAPQLTSVLAGLWVFHFTRADLHTARGMAEEMLQLGQKTRDRVTLGIAHLGLGEILFDMGEFASAKEHCEQALALFPSQLFFTSAPIRFLSDVRMATLGHIAWILWHLGYPDQALHRVHEALALAQESSHPFTMVYGLQFALITRAHRGEYALVQERNEEMLALAVEQGFPPFVAAGTFVRSVMLVGQGQVGVEEGIAQMRRSMDAYRATGTETRFPELLAGLAAVQGAVGQVEEGFASLTEAQATVVRTGERRHESTLSLLKGSLLLGQTSRDRDPGDHRENAAQAEACFRHAIDVARQQKAKSLELRAATSLSRLWQQQGKRDEARKLLGEIYGWFTEGFETADLKEAKALLDELSA
jgi:predicted ATPase